MEEFMLERGVGQNMGANSPENWQMPKTEIHSPEQTSGLAVSRSNGQIENDWQLKSFDPQNNVYNVYKPRTDKPGYNDTKAIPKEMFEKMNAEKLNRKLSPKEEFLLKNVRAKRNSLMNDRNFYSIDPHPKEGETQEDALKRLDSEILNMINIREQLRWGDTESAENFCKSEITTMRQQLKDMEEQLKIAAEKFRAQEGQYPDDEQFYSVQKYLKEYLQRLKLQKFDPGTEAFIRQSAEFARQDLRQTTRGKYGEEANSLGMQINDLKKSIEYSEKMFAGK